MLFAKRYFGTSYVLRRKILYDLIGVKENASKKEILKSYRSLLLKHHPDKGGNTQQYLQISKAKEILTDPIQRREYDKMTVSQHQSFATIWKNKYSWQKEKIQEIETFMKKTSMFSSLLVPIGNLAQRILNRSIQQEKVVYGERDLYIMLDVSRSMDFFDENDIPKHIQTSKKQCFIDGVIVHMMYIDDRYSDIIDNIRYISKAVKNIKTLISDLIKMPYTATLVTFSNTSRLYISRVRLSTFLERLGGPQIKASDVERTHIYDTLKEAIVKQDQFLDMTTFIMLTDGEDFKSITEANELYALIKEKGNINLIILTLNVDAHEELKKIVSAAKFGKILEINNPNNQYGFKNMSEAFSHLKDIIISENQTSMKDIFKL